MQQSLPKKIYFAAKKNPDVFLLWPALLVVVFSIVMALPAFLIPLGLPPEGDAMDYRVPILRWIIRHGTFPIWDWTMVDDYPMFAEILMLPFYALHPALARLVPFLAYLGLGVSSGAIIANIFKSELLKPRTLFFLGAAWALTLRPLELQSNLIMIDNIASFFLITSLYFVMRERPMTAGIFAAMAAATRYTVWPSAAMLGLMMVWAGWGKIQPVRLLKQFILFGIIVFLGVLPFMLRNYLVNEGNPFFPIGSKTDWSSAVANYGRGTGLFALLLFPYDLLYTNSFVLGFYDYTVGKLFYAQLFAFLPFCFRGLGDFFRQKKVLILVGFAGLHFIFWFLSSQQLRFLVPSLLLFIMLILAFLLERKAYWPIALVTILGLLATYSIQKDSMMMGLGFKPISVAAEKEAAEACFNSIAAELGGETIGFIHRDGILGFFDRDFVYVKGSSYAIDRPSNRDPAWIYMNAANRSKELPGYILYPPSAPCIYKRVN